MIWQFAGWDDGIIHDDEMTVRFERPFYAIDESIFYLFGRGGVDDVIQRAHKHQVAVIGGGIRRGPPAFAGVPGCEGELFGPSFFSSAMCLDSVSSLCRSPLCPSCSKSIYLKAWMSPA